MLASLLLALFALAPALPVPRVPMRPAGLPVRRVGVLGVEGRRVVVVIHKVGASGGGRRVCPPGMV